jgi:hypothetical protein
MKKGKVIRDNKLEKKGVEYFNGVPKSDEEVIYVSFDVKSFLVYFKLNSIVEKPGIYKVLAKTKSGEELIDTINFLYSKSPPLSPDEILAIESNPNSAKSIIMQLGCKYATKN